MNFAVLDLLSDGDYHSGQMLGDHLGVSRTAVWKQIEAFQQLGVPIESVKGKGYRWLTASVLLKADNIHAALSDEARSFYQLAIHDRLGSTNTVALQKASEAAPSGASFIAEMQSDGRGRRGRVWQSPVAQNLYVSTIFRVDDGAAGLQGLSLVVGISLAESLRQHYGLACELKWPNDIWVHGKKLAGILIELQGDVTGDCAAVIGWGLNVNLLPTEVTNSIDQDWTSLQLELGQPVDRNQLLACLLSGLYFDLRLLQQQGFSVFQERWSALDCLYNVPVLLSAGNQLVSGVAEGVDNIGGLVVNTTLGQQVFHGGEVSVRKQ